jgi:hypothetical protein
MISHQFHNTDEVTNLEEEDHLICSTTFQGMQNYFNLLVIEVMAMGDSLDVTFLKALQNHN